MVQLEKQLKQNSWAWLAGKITNGEYQARKKAIRAKQLKYRPSKKIVSLSLLE